MARAPVPPWDSELPHRCRESCSFSFAEREEPPRDILPLEFSRLNGPNFLGGRSLEEAALFRQVSCRPLENVELPKQASPLAGSCEGDDCVQVPAVRQLALEHSWAPI